jgi:hypothetical protein
MSEPMAGLPDDVEQAKRDLQSAVRGDDRWRFPDVYPPEEQEWIDRHMEYDERQVNKQLDEIHAEVDDIDMQEAAQDFMYKMGMTPTPDATGQLLEVFVPCLRIMCERGYEPTGALWRKAGVLGIIWDVRKKFERLWYRTWTLGIRHDDSGFDLINFVGMLLRSNPNSRFGDAGEPAPPKSTEAES